MAQVSLQIGNYNYSLSCRDGEEAHLLALGADVDTKVKEAISTIGSASEVRQLVFAALLLADELRDLRSGAAPQQMAPQSVEFDGAIGDIASRLEALATVLEQSAN